MPSHTDTAGHTKAYHYELPSRRPQAQGDQEIVKNIREKMLLYIY